MTWIVTEEELRQPEGWLPLSIFLLLFYSAPPVSSRDTPESRSKLNSTASMNFTKQLHDPLPASFRSKLASPAV